MKKLLLFLILFIFAVCISCDKQIYDLPSKTLTYNELPIEVQTYLSESKDFWDVTQEDLLFVNESDRNEYRLETIDAIIGPWIIGERLINNKKNTEYKIAQGTPSPYILYKNRLYIPRDFMYLVEDSKYMTYTEYELD